MYKIDNETSLWNNRFSCLCPEIYKTILFGDFENQLQNHYKTVILKIKTDSNQVILKIISKITFKL